MIAKIVLAGLVMLACVVLGGAKVLGLEQMRKRAAHLGFTIEEYRRIGALELLAAAGIAVGFAVPGIGVLAACGLLVLLGGALAAHRNAGDAPAAMAPAVVVTVIVSGYVVAALAAA